MVNWNIDETPYPGPDEHVEPIGTLVVDGKKVPVFRAGFTNLSSEAKGFTTIESGKTFSITWTHTILGP